MRPVVGFVAPVVGETHTPSRRLTLTIEEACERSLDVPGAPLMVLGLPGYFLDGKHITEAP